MPNRNQNNVSNLNQGVDYMSQNQQPVNPGMQPQQPMMQQPVNPGVQQPVNPGAQQPVNPGAQQPIVNTTALKAQAGNLANNAKAGVNNLIGKVKGDKKNMVIAIVAVVVVALVLVMGGANFLSPSASIVNKYMSGMKSGNAKKIAKLYHKAKQKSIGFCQKFHFYNLFITRNITIFSKYYVLLADIML